MTPEQPMRMGEGFVWEDPQPPGEPKVESVT